MEGQVTGERRNKRCFPYKAERNTQIDENVIHLVVFLFPTP